jgi:hypothetical protein
MGFAWIWFCLLLIVLVLRVDAPSSPISNLLHLQRRHRISKNVETKALPFAF